jgi:TM2 domain-containing membrane protein YozV
LLDFEAQGEHALAIHALERPAAARPAQGKNRFVAAALAFLFGVFGVHKFYLGRTGAGLTMLLVSVLLGILILPLVMMSLIAFVECIIYLVSSEEEFEKRYAPGGKSWF